MEAEMEVIGAHGAYTRLGGEIYFCRPQHMGSVFLEKMVQRLDPKLTIDHRGPLKGASA